MPFPAIAYRVLIASPSDTVAARFVVRESLHSCNSASSFSTGIVLLPVMWEIDAVPEVGERPQGIINRQLVAGADMVIGTFWTRFGSPTGIAESGTEEEIQQFIDTGKPVMLYFSNGLVDPRRLDATQYAKVTAYRKKMQAQAIYAEYDSDDQLRGRLMNDLMRVVQKLAADNPRKNPPQSPSVMLIKAQFLAYVDSLEKAWKEEQEKFAALTEYPNFYATQVGHAILSSSEESFHDYAHKMYGRVDDSIAFAVDNLGSKAFGIRRARHFHWGNLQQDGEDNLHTFWRVGEAFMDQVCAVRSVVETSI